MDRDINRDKEFDCVRMKAEIQRRLLEEEQELGKEEAILRRQERLLSDPILGPLTLAKLAEKVRERQAG